MRMMKKLLQRRANCAFLQKVKALWTYHNMRVLFYGFAHAINVKGLFTIFSSRYKDSFQKPTTRKHQLVNN